MTNSPASLVRVLLGCPGPLGGATTRKLVIRAMMFLGSACTWALTLTVPCEAGFHSARLPLAQ